MDIQKRQQDLTKVFDHNWQANRGSGRERRQEAINDNKKRFDRMFGIQDRESRRKKILFENSVVGQVQELNRRMSNYINGQKQIERNNFKNNFK